MPIFKEESGKLKKLTFNPLTTEKGLQVLFEHNLLEVLDMHFLASEFSTTFGGRIDTLAVDTNGAPVIIEYKRNKNDNVINQALSYLKWLKSQTADFFEMLIIKRLEKEIADKLIQIIDWRNPRVICIAENYNKYDTDAVEVIPVRIELFKYRYYENGIFSLEPLNTIERPVEKVEKLKESIVSTDLVNINQQLSKAQPDIKQIFEELRSRIFQMDENIEEKITNHYISYRVSKSFVEIHVSKERLRLLLRPVEYDDFDNMIKKIPDSYKWSLNRQVYLKDMDELDYVMNLIEQSYNDVL